MNEIELQKSLVKEAFTKRAFPNLGLVDGNPQESALAVRNCIWQVCGYLANEKAPNGFGHAKHLQQRSKKKALVMLYKLWSGFSKNLRYQLTQKGVTAVKVPRFGTFSKVVDDNAPLMTQFSF